jgi:hypothetical protein
MKLLVDWIVSVEKGERIIHEMAYDYSTGTKKEDGPKAAIQAL